ncbi:hypothetical protein NS220_16070 [Microbacterium testaceum]|uniref:Uncharacterized protein n=1 Tax=Microbacterium testaceum TaxID=2033 RepID=A0A147ETK8_MICTE|nr:hypothetical protein [Microbacterium testaceum]KTR89048.1 hypothetical protein NS220_16070 [Microbacterium testaceum]
MNADDGSELARLRARAYGPDADISDDPAAVARLAELEARDRGSRSPEEADTGDRLEPVAGVEPDAPDDDVRPRGRGRVPIRSRRAFWGWALTVAVVAAVSSALTAAGMHIVPVSRSAGVPQIATLTPDEGRALPGAFGPASSDARAYPDFYGMTAFVSYAQFGPEGERNACIFLVPTDTLDKLEQQGYSAGFSESGCGAGVFPAAVQFVVNSLEPAEFVARFPPGSSVQFVFDGENLGVFSDAG